MVRSADFLPPYPSEADCLRMIARLNVDPSSAPLLQSVVREGGADQPGL